MAWAIPWRTATEVERLPDVEIELQHGRPQLRLGFGAWGSADSSAMSEASKVAGAATRRGRLRTSCAMSGGAGTASSTIRLKAGSVPHQRGLCDEDDLLPGIHFVDQPRSRRDENVGVESCRSRDSIRPARRCGRGEGRRTVIPSRRTGLRKVTVTVRPALLDSDRGDVAVAERRRHRIGRAVDVGSARHVGAARRTGSRPP